MLCLGHGLNDDGLGASDDEATLGMLRPVQIAITGAKKAAQYERSMVTRLVAWLPDFVLACSIGAFAYHPLCAHRICR